MNLAMLLGLALTIGPDDFGDVSFDTRRPYGFRLLDDELLQWLVDVQELHGPGVAFSEYGGVTHSQGPGRLTWALWD